MWYEIFWERKDKFGDESWTVEDKNGKIYYHKEVYFLDSQTKKINKGNVVYICGTTGVFHVNDEKNKRHYCIWNNIEPLTNEGYKQLEKRAKEITENEENTKIFLSYIR